MRRYYTPIAIAIFVITCFALLIQVAQAQTRLAVLTWTAVTTDTDGNALTGVTYSVYQGPKTTGKQKVATLLTSLTYTAVALPVGETCWRVSATANGIEGAASAEVCKTFSPSAPGVPLLTVN